MKFSVTQNKAALQLAGVVFLFTTIILGIIQVVIPNPMLLAERFYRGAGWIEIFIIGLYAGIIAFHMHDPSKSARWRTISWTVFSIVFFSQLILGLLVSNKFLMTGKLHLPIPAMILSGPLYRGQLSVMTILFISTVILTGPAWCSQLCYFGALDGLAAHKGVNRGKTKRKFAIKHTILLVIIVVSLLLRLLGIGSGIATLLAVSFGIGGLIFLIVYSRRRGKMMHCLIYCPVGTLVNYLKFINPFRLAINNNCTFCSSCSAVCKYDALSLTDLSNKKPAKTCTLCGDCISVCHMESLHYKFFWLKPAQARKLYLGSTLIVHAVFLGLARI